VMLDIAMQTDLMDSLVFAIGRKKDEKKFRKINKDLTLFAKPTPICTHFYFHPSAIAPDGQNLVSDVSMFAPAL